MNNEIWRIRILLNYQSFQINSFATLKSCNPIRQKIHFNKSLNSISKVISPLRCLSTRPRLRMRLIPTISLDDLWSFLWRWQFSSQFSEMSLFLYPYSQQKLSLDSIVRIHIWHFTSLLAAALCAFVSQNGELYFRVLRVILIFLWLFIICFAFVQPLDVRECLFEFIFVCAKFIRNGII